MITSQISNLTLVPVFCIVNSLAPDKEATDIHSPLDKLLVREFLNNLITLGYHLFQEECP